MKRLLLIFTALLCLFATAGCSTDRGVNVTSCTVDSVTPNGLRAIKAVLKVGIVNPMNSFRVSRIDGVINNGGRELATFTTGKIKVDRKSNKVYPLNCEGTIAKDVGLVELLGIAGSQDFSRMTVDLKVKVRTFLGFCKTLKFNDIKVSDLMEPSVASAYLDMVINEAMI